MARRAWWAAGLCAAVAALGWAGQQGSGREPLRREEGAAGPLRREEAPASSDASQDLESSLIAFRNHLERFREGASELRSELEVITARCVAEGRPDVRDVYAYFTSMPAADLRVAWELEQRFKELYGRARDAKHAGLSISEWRRTRPQLLEDLDTLIEVGAKLREFTPYARALSLRADLLQGRITADLDFAPDQHRAWIEQCEKDAMLAIRLFEQAGMRTPQLQPLGALGWIARVEDHWDEAEELFEELIDLARTVNNKDYLIRGLRALVSLADSSGNLERTSRLLSELARIEEPNPSWELVRQQASLLVASDELQRAAEYLAKHKPSEIRALDEWHIWMEIVLSRKGDLDGAAAHASALRKRETEYDKSEVIAIALADMDLRDDRAADVLVRLDKLHPDRFSLRLRASMARTRGKALMQLGRTAEALAVLESALRWGDAAEAALAFTDIDRPFASIVGEIVGVEAAVLLARGHLEQADPLSAAWVIENWQSRRLRAELSTSGAGLERAAILPWARAYEAGMITWMIGADSSIVIHVDSEGHAAGKTLPLGRKVLEEAVSRVRQAVIEGDAESWSTMAAELQEALFTEELADRIQMRAPMGRPRLLLCSHGTLANLPWGVLPLFAPKQERVLVPLCLPGLLEQDPGTALDRNRLREWSLCGDPVDQHGTTSLPGAGTELDELAELYPGGEVFRRSTFDRASFQRALESGRPLHVATHLRTDSGPKSRAQAKFSRAGLELSRSELFSVGAVRESSPRLPLVVLAACETGSGDFVDAQAAPGVTLAFLQSGTRNLVVTCWPVEDEPARRFAMAFHRALIAGELPSVAVAIAQAELRTGGASAADWAAFRFVGRD